jgi:predicted TIM-barrel fold metal-dependent hydrolase
MTALAAERTTERITDRIKVIDVDTHVTEPEDVWTARVSRKWGDRIPHVQQDKDTGDWFWMLGGERGSHHPVMASAGWKEPFPSFPMTMDEVDPAAWRPHDRLKRMDEYGMYAQVIYPNVGGFGSGRFMAMKEPALQLECVQAYNDFLTEWCSVDPKRLLPITALPFWDVEASVAEINRCFKMGHRGVIFTNEPDFYGQPMLSDPHWDPVWAAAQDLGLSINFHIASGNSAILRHGHKSMSDAARVSMASVMIFMGNARAIGEAIMSGIPERFPNLKFVSVESGIGWIPFCLDALDWQWMNNGGPTVRPKMELLPSEYFRRQFYACFWFEQGPVIRSIVEQLPDNLLYETDFPHPTSMSPGPASIAHVPKDFIDETMSDFPDELLVKVLRDNAARIYHVEL